jgi:hypothetical protein
VISSGLFLEVQLPPKKLTIRAGAKVLFLQLGGSRHPHV